MRPRPRPLNIVPLTCSSRNCASLVGPVVDAKKANQAEHILILLQYRLARVIKHSSHLEVTPDAPIRYPWQCVQDLTCQLNSAVPWPSEPSRPSQQICAKQTDLSSSATRMNCSTAKSSPTPTVCDLQTTSLICNTKGVCHGLQIASATTVHGPVVLVLEIPP